MFILESWEITPVKQLTLYVFNDPLPIQDIYPEYGKCSPQHWIQFNKWCDSNSETNMTTA